MRSVEAEYRGNREPSQAGFLSFELELAFVPLEGGKSSLRLLKPLILKLEPLSMKITVQDWSIEVDYSRMGQLPREIARRFLQFLGRAEAEALTETEQADWLRMVDYVDFQQFCNDRSAPRYVEGTLRARDGLVIVEWHDGARETLDRTVARALNEVDPGEKFSAFIKIGKENKTATLERVSILENQTGVEDWDSWPNKG